MSTPKNPDIIEYKWWYRWVGAASLLSLGALLIGVAVPELVQLVHDLRTFPPEVVTSNVWPAALPLGLAIIGLGLFFLFPPILVERRRRAEGKPELTGTLLRTKLAIGGAFVALLLYPVLSFGSDIVVSSILERHGYSWTAVDQGHHSRIHEYRWLRPVGAK